MLDLIGEGSNAETAGEDDGVTGMDIMGAATFGLGKVSDWEETGRRPRSANSPKNSGAGTKGAAMDEMDAAVGGGGSGGGGGGGKQALKTVASKIKRRPSYLDLAEVGPDVNGAELLGGGTPTPTSATLDHGGRKGERGAKSNNLTDDGPSSVSSADSKEPSPERSASEVVIEMDVGSAGGKNK